MSFFPKLLIFVGWMLIFPAGIVDSVSTKGTTELEKVGSFRSTPNETRTFHVLFAPVHVPAFFAYSYTFNVFVCKLSIFGAASAEEYLYEACPCSNNREVSLFPPRFTVNESELDAGQTFLVAVIIKNKNNEQLPNPLEKVKKGIFRWRTILNKIFNPQFGPSSSLRESATNTVHVSIHTIFEHDVKYTAHYKQNSEDGLLLPSLNVKEDDLDAGLSFIVAVIGKNEDVTIPSTINFNEGGKVESLWVLRDEELQSLEDEEELQRTSGGPVAAKPPNGLFGSTVAAVIAAVVLHVGTIICS